MTIAVPHHQEARSNHPVQPPACHARCEAPFLQAAAKNEAAYQERHWPDFHSNQTGASIHPADDRPHE